MLNKFQSKASVKDQIDNGYLYFGVYRNDTLSGYLSLEQRHPSLFISKFYLAKEARGYGLAREMMDYCKHLAAEKECTQLELTVNKHNTHTIGVYEHFGFQKIREAVFDIGEGYIMDDFVMQAPVKK